MRKPVKSELSREIEQELNQPPPTEVPLTGNTIPTAIVIDFMAYARKVPLKKLKLRTFEDFANNLWKTFRYLSRDSSRIDIVFDLYLKDSVKQYERDRRSKTDPINTSIRRRDQPLPVEMDRFWASSDNKIYFQQFFITWAIENYDSVKPLFLGGLNVDDLTTCLKLHNGIVQSLCLLKCNHEEADDRIMYHVNHTVAIDNFTRMIVVSADTDVLVCLMYHFS